MLQIIINSSILVTSYFIVLIRARCKRTDLEHVNSIPLLVSSFLLFFVSVFVFAFQRVASNSACSSRGKKFYRVNTQYKISRKNRLEKRRHVSRRAGHVLQIESTRIDDTALAANTLEPALRLYGWQAVSVMRHKSYVLSDRLIDRSIDRKPIINCRCTVIQLGSRLFET